MKPIMTLLTTLGLALGLSATASASLATIDPVGLTRINPPSAGAGADGLQLAARLINHNGHTFRYRRHGRRWFRGHNLHSGRYGRRWVRGHIGPRRVWSGRNNRTSGRHYNPTRRYRLQSWISRHRRHF